MKNLEINTFGLITVLVCLAPVCIFLIDDVLFFERLTDISSVIASALSFFFLICVFGGKQRLYKTATHKMYTIPLVVILLFVQTFLIFAINPTSFNVHWDFIVTSMTSLVTFIFLFVIFGGRYELIKPAKLTKNKE